MTSLPSVEVPAAGASYNPSYSDHQDLLWKAAVVEMKKEKAQQKIDYHTTRMFPDVKDAPTHQTWLSEMSEGIDGENVADDDSDNEEENKKQEGENIRQHIFINLVKDHSEMMIVLSHHLSSEMINDELKNGQLIRMLIPSLHDCVKEVAYIFRSLSKTGSGSEDDEDKPENKLKTRKQRRKAKLAKAAEAKRAREIAQKQKNQDVFRYGMEGFYFLTARCYF